MSAYVHFFTSLALFTVLTACSHVMQADDGRLSKVDAAARQDGVDYCATHAWYGDGMCDVFCFEPDPDCDEEPVSPEPQTQPEPQPPAQCPDDASDDVLYFSKDLNICSQDYISQVCPPGTENFTIEGCGCGCIGVPECGESTPLRNYVGDLNECSRILYSCDPGWVHFSDACGCGCERDAGPLCSAMDAQGKGGCGAELGVLFDGIECITISGCTCEGDDCDRLYESHEQCQRHTGDCSLQCGDPEGPICDVGVQFGPEACPIDSVFTTLNCSTACVEPETCNVILMGGQ